MSCISFLAGTSRWSAPLACGPGSPELSKPYSQRPAMVKIFTFTLYIYMHDLRFSSVLKLKLGQSGCRTWRKRTPAACML